MVPGLSAYLMPFYLQDVKKEIIVLILPVGNVRNPFEICDLKFARRAIISTLQPVLVWLSCFERNI